MHRRTCLLTGTLLAIAWPASHAADDVEGRWLAEVGPPDNRALVGLELGPGTDGTLRARYIGSGDLFLVSAFDVADGRNRWRSHVGGWVLQRPLVGARLLHASLSGARRRAEHFMPQRAGLVKIHRQDGRIAWHWAAPAASPGAFLFGMVAAPTAVAGRVVVGGLDGTLYAFDDEGGDRPGRRWRRRVCRRDGPGMV